MANDAKLGLVMGVSVVLVIGLVFFRTEPIAAKLPANSAQQTSQVHRSPVNAVAPTPLHNRKPR